MIEERYREILAAVDAEFARNRALHGRRIRCGSGCTDCCYHVFPITPIEAAEVARGVAGLPDHLRRQVVARALQYLEPRVVDGERRPCPALDADRCLIYEHRPLMCHKFGMPLFNPDKPGRIFACELNFGDGEEIDDPDLIQIQTGIHQAWTELKSDPAIVQGEMTGPLSVAHAVVRANEGLGDQASSNLRR